MPILLLLRSKLLRFGFLLLIFVLVILSYKRLAIFAYATSLLVYFYFAAKSTGNRTPVRGMAVILSSFMFAAILAFAFVKMSGIFNLDWSERMSSIVETGGSGRLAIYREVFAAFASEPEYWLIGRGHEAVSLTLQLWAHNDYLEILYNFGLIGLSLYGLFIIKLVRILFEMRKYQYPHTGAFAVSLVWFVWGSMFSVLVTLPMWFLGLALFWGMAVADFENYKMQCHLAAGESSEWTLADMPYQEA